MIMKKIFSGFFILIMLFICSLPCFATENSPTAGSETEATVPAKEETTQNMSSVRLIVSDFSVDNDCVIPGKQAKIKITVKNTNSEKAVRNAIFKLTDSERELIPDGTGVQYVKYFEDSYILETTLSAVNTAKEGRHELTLSAEYEDRYYSSYSFNQALYVNVKQPVSIDYSGIALPVKSQQESTVTISPEIMNTGKGEISNVKIKTEIDGLSSGGTCFIGTIPAGESKSGTVNLQVSNDKLGETAGIVKISYCDCYGKTYSEDINISTNIIKKIEVNQTEKEEKVTDKIPWWVFIAGGIVIGGGIGAAIPIAVYSKKQRKQDEQRL